MTKYLVLEDETALRFPILFPGHIKHANMAALLVSEFKVISAGIVNITEYYGDINAIVVSGSMSLNIPTSDRRDCEDRELIDQQIIQQP